MIDRTCTICGYSRGIWIRTVGLHRPLCVCHVVPTIVLRYNRKPPVWTGRKR